MTLVSLPFTKFSNKMFSTSLPLIFKTRIPYTTCLNPETNPINLPQKSAPIPHVVPFPSVCQGLIQGSFSTRHKDSSTVVALGAKNPASGEEDNRAVEAVLKLYTALRNRNVTELSEVIGEECRCVCNFISIFQPFHGKKEVLDFFITLMEFLGKNIEFVVQPTLHDGMNVGVSWKLEWKQAHVPLGKGYSFHLIHIYQGKVTIRNVEMFMEPLFHIEPLRLKLMGFVMTVVDKIGASKDKLKRGIYVLLALALHYIAVFVLRHSIRTLYNKFTLFPKHLVSTTITEVPSFWEVFNSKTLSRNGRKSTSKTESQKTTQRSNSILLNTAMQFQSKSGHDFA